MTTTSDSPKDNYCLDVLDVLYTLRGGPAPLLTSPNSECPKITANIQEAGDYFTDPVLRNGYGCDNGLKVVKLSTNQCCK